MKVFRGSWDDGTWDEGKRGRRLGVCVEVGICVHGVDGPHWHPLDLHAEVIDASPEFGWGIVRPAALQLAGAILAEVFDVETARALYVEFAVSVVCKWPRNWRITAAEVSATGKERRDGQWCLFGAEEDR